MVVMVLELEDDHLYPKPKQEVARTDDDEKKALPNVSPYLYLLLVSEMKASFVCSLDYNQHCHHYHLCYLLVCSCNPVKHFVLSLEVLQMI